LIQKPALTLALSRRERGLTEVPVRGLPFSDNPSNSGFEITTIQPSPLRERELTGVSLR
jgi:hypothetical protein